MRLESDFTLRRELKRVKPSYSEVLLQFDQP
jgi:hypothetical protein